MPASDAQPSQHGFTLIELLVTIAIAAICLSLAVPSMVTFQRNAELTSATNSVTAAINAARGEAMKRNMNAFVVPVDGASWSSGFRVYVKNGTTAFVLGTDLLVMQQDAPPSYLTLTGTGTAAASAPYLMFNGSGYATDTSAGFTNATTLSLKRNDVSGTEAYKQTRNVMLSQTGRVRVCTPTGASDTNCDTATP